MSMSVPELPNLSHTSIVRFLLTSPALRELPKIAVDKLAACVEKRRYANGEFLFKDEVPNTSQPLRIVVHGHASWLTSRTYEKAGAWVLMPGSVRGFASVNEWARRNGRADVWHMTPTKITSRALGPVWTLELPPERFDEVFNSEGGGHLCERLQSVYPTVVHAPDMVASLRELGYFGRVNSSLLYRMLERARTVRFSSVMLAMQDKGKDKEKKKDQPPPPEQQQQQQQQPPEQQQQQYLFMQDEMQDAAQEQLEQLLAPEVNLMVKRSYGRALYFILDGQLQVPTDSGTQTLTAGDIGGPTPFARSQRLMGAPWTTSGCVAMVLDAYALTEMMRTDPGFSRSLGPIVRNPGAINEVSK